MLCNVLYNGLLEFLLEYLYTSDKVSLKRINKLTNQKITWKLVDKNFDKIVIDEMTRKMGQRMGQEIIEKMKLHDHVLSGSFLLQCLTGNFWETSDIDFYFYAKSKNSSDYMEKIQENELHIHDFSHWLLSQEFATCVDSYNSLPIRCVAYEKDHLNIDLLQVKPEFSFRSTFHAKYHKFFPNMIYDKETDMCTFKFSSIWEYIQETSDFSFLTNMYDGNRLKVSNWTSIIEKSSTVECFKGTYIRKGQYCAKSFLHRINDRIEKYELRGYQMKFKDDLNEDYFNRHINHCLEDRCYDSDYEIYQPIFIGKKSCNLLEIVAKHHVKRNLIKIIPKKQWTWNKVISKFYSKEYIIDYCKGLIKYPDWLIRYKMNCKKKVPSLVSVRVVKKAQFFKSKK